MTDITPTHRCNNCCVMCPAIMPPPGHLRDMDTGEIMKHIDSLKDPEVIIFTGGEPTIRRDIFPIMTHARKKFPSKEIKLITNGRILSYPEFAERAGRLKIAVITELHGPDAGRHDRITGVPGSFNQTVEGIRNSLKCGIKTELRIVVHRMNHEDVEQIATLAYGLGIESVVFFPIDIRGNAYLNRKKVMIENSEILPYIERAADFLAERGIDVELYHLPLCILKPRYRKFARGVTAPLMRIHFDEKCEKCRRKSECSGLWKTYFRHFGSAELEPITR